MKLTEAYTIYNNSLHSMDSQLAEAIDRIIDSKSIQNDQLQAEVARYKQVYEICEGGMFKAHDWWQASQVKLDRTELAEVKARMENEQMRKNILELREYIGQQEHSDFLEYVVDILYDISQGKAGDSDD